MNWIQSLYLAIYFIQRMKKTFTIFFSITYFQATCIMLKRKIIMNKTLRHVLFEFLLPSMKKVGTIETTWCKSSWENVAICCRLNKPISRPFKRYNREAKERKSSNPYGYYVYTICVYDKLIKYQYEIF